MKHQTSIDNIFYYQEKPQDILNLGLRFSFEEIGFYLTFKSAYFFHKGKIPTSKLFQFCRVFDNQEKFKIFIQNNFQEVDSFFVCQSFNDEINFIEDKSRKRRDAINSRWENTIVSTNENTIVSDLNILNNKHKTINTKQETKKIKPKDFIPPTLQEVKDYCQERKNNVDPAKFFDYYNAGSWKDTKGKQVKNWKQKLITWENNSSGRENAPQSNTNANLSDFINKMIGHTLVSKIIVSTSNKAILHFKTESDYQTLLSLEKELREKVKEEIASSLSTSGFEFKF